MIRPRPGSFETWGIALAFAGCIGADLVLARAQVPDGDTVQLVVEALGVLHHNLLLDHWALTIDSFYFTDLPLTTILTALFGPRLWLIYVAPVLVLALVLLAALLLVARAAPAGAARWPGACAVLVLLGLPFSPPQRMFLVAAIHIGTLLFCLLALLIIQPALSGRRLNRLLLPLFVLLLFMASAGDPQADVLFIIPVLLLMALRLWLWPATCSADDALIFAGALCAGVAGALWPGFIAHHHGYATIFDFVAGFVPNISQAGANARAVVQSLRLLMDAKAAALSWVTWPGVLAATRLLTLGAVLVLSLLVIWRLPRARNDGVKQVLVLGGLCLFGANAMSQGFAVAVSGGPEAPGAAVRYVAPGFVLLVIAAICETQSWSWRGRWLSAFRGAAVLFCAVFFLSPRRKWSRWQRMAMAIPRRRNIS